MNFQASLWFTASISCMIMRKTLTSTHWAAITKKLVTSKTAASARPFGFEVCCANKGHNADMRNTSDHYTSVKHFGSRYPARLWHTLQMRMTRLTRGTKNRNSTIPNIQTRDGQNSLSFFNEKMDVIGFELDLIVLQCFEFVAYL